jgi:glycerol uptake facilitator-like aquaporin
MLVFASGMIAIAVGPYNEPDSFKVPLIVALTNWIAITLFIFAAAPASGGHLNPFITLATLTAGLSTFPRSLLYIIAQCIGGIIGGFWLKLGLGGPDYFPSVSTGYKSFGNPRSQTILGAMNSSLCNSMTDI